MERTFYPGSEGEQTDNGIRIRGFYGMKKSKDAKYGYNGCSVKWMQNHKQAAERQRKTKIKHKKTTDYLLFF